MAKKEVRKMVLNKIIKITLIVYSIFLVIFLIWLKILHEKKFGEGDKENEKK